MIILEFDFITFDLFTILDSLNYSLDDINGLTPAIFRDGELSRASLSAVQPTRSAEITIIQRVSTAKAASGTRDDRNLVVQDPLHGDWQC